MSMHLPKMYFADSESEWCFISYFWSCLQCLLLAASRFRFSEIRVTKSESQIPKKPLFVEAGDIRPAIEALALRASLRSRSRRPYRLQRLVHEFKLVQACFSETGPGQYCTSKKTSVISRWLVLLVQQVQSRGFTESLLQNHRIDNSPKRNRFNRKKIVCALLWVEY